MNYYNEQECSNAINAAEYAINEKTKDCLVYTRGTNDCAALFVQYDRDLRGSHSKANFDFTWGNPEEFVVKLGQTGFTVASYLEHCGYEIIKNKRPLVGDVGFSGGALIASPRGWLTTSEDNVGVVVGKQIMHLEFKLSIIARPIKDH